MRSLIFPCLRWLFAGLMLTTSIGKLLDNRGFAEVIETYDIFLFSGSWLLFFALGFSLFELWIGIRLIRGQGNILSGKALTGLHLMYTVLAVTSLSRGLDINNCGCFGIFWARPLTLSTVFEDGALLALSILFYRWSKK